MLTHILKILQQMLKDFLSVCVTILGHYTLKG